MQHISEDHMERYAMRTLPDSETGPLEEHLLICQSCQDHLTATDEYVAAMIPVLRVLRRSKSEANLRPVPAIPHQPNSP